MAAVAAATRTRSVGTAACDASDRPTRLLVGPAAEPRPGSSDSLLLGLCQAPGDALFSLLIKRPRDLGRPSLLCQGDHHQLDLLGAAPDLETITRFQRASGLDAIAIDVDFAAFNSIASQCPRLEEAGRPEPLVGSNSACRGRFVTPHRPELIAMAIGA